MAVIVREDELLDVHRRELTSLTELIGAEAVEKLCRVLPRPPPTTVRINPLVTTVPEVVNELRNLVPAELKGTVRPHKVLPDVVLVDTLGPLERSAAGLPRMWLSRRCAEAVLRGASVYAPGVLAAESHLRVGERAAVFVDLLNKTTKGALRIDSASREYYLGNGVAEMNREALFHSSHAKGVAVRLTEARFVGPSLNGFLEDRTYLQNLPSAAVSHVLDPQPGELVLDMCASPGGKTTHIAALMQNKGRVVAFDRSFDKVETIRSNAAKLRLSIVEAHRNNAVKYSKYIADGFEDQPVPDRELPMLGRESFDRILVDPPCSALGIRPRLHLGDDLKAEIHHKASFQRQFLRAAVMLLKPGGVLTFSTCTINPLENEGNVRFALDEFPLQLAEQKYVIGGPGLPNFGLSDDERQLVQRFEPWESYDTPGFFCAKFVKIGMFT